MKKLAFLLLAASLLGTAAARAQAPTVISALPYTITAKGAYVLTQDLSSSQTSGALIEIDASNVTIDFQGHYISGPAGVTNQINAIYANERSNLTIQNGTIANCFRGVLIDGNNTATSNNRNHSVDNLRVTRCLSAGIFVRYAAASSITNCKVSQVGADNGGGTGIFVGGSGVTVQNCAVSQVTGPFNIGISLATGSFARANTISDCIYGVVSGKYQDNLTANISGTAFMSGTDAGGNN